MVVLLDPSDDPDDILRQNRNREKQYMFDYVFDAIATQEEVYEKTTKGISKSRDEPLCDWIYCQNETSFVPCMREQRHISIWNRE